MSELGARLERFRARMDTADPGWELALVSSNVNLYYFTGTMQDGILLIPRNGEAVFWVRRSFLRAVDESSFPQIRPMQSTGLRQKRRDRSPGRIPGDRTRIARHVPAAPEILSVP